MGIGTISMFTKIMHWSQVANAMTNPTAFRPWKPNCQMTPNQEDIIGGRFVIVIVSVNIYYIYMIHITDGAAYVRWPMQ